MSYEKAMKHARNVRKCRKQSRQFMGFDTGPSDRPWKSIWTCPEYVIRNWFSRRHDGDKQHSRECIRQKIAELRATRRTEQA